MSPELLRKIEITKEELQDPKIDERLRLQETSVPGAIEPAEEKHRFQWIYSAWFYLLLAGAIGAFAAWAIIEPYFEDGIIFIGRVEQVDPFDIVENIRRLRVSGVDVYVDTNRTIISGWRGKAIRYSVDHLEEEQIVKIMAEAISDQAILAADVIRLEPPDTPAEDNVSVNELKRRADTFGFVLFPIVAGLVGFMVGGVEGTICRTFSRAVRCAVIGLVAGVIGGSLSSIAAGLGYELIGRFNEVPMASPAAFIFQMFRRGLFWTIAGSAIGLGQGLALKSRRLRVNGFIGGMLGGLLGGLLFDPIALLFADRVLLEGAELSRAVGFTIMGGMVGLMIGLTDMLTRNAWLKVTRGPLRGKEFSFNLTPIRIGSSPKNEIYLFKDLKISPIHAQINRLRDTYEICDNESATGTYINGQRTKRIRLADGDQIRIGDSEFTYFTREKRI